MLQDQISFGCSVTDTETVSVTSSPNKPTFIQNGDTLTSSSEYDNQWYHNDSILTGDTSQNLIFSVNGNYFVIVSNEANGCGTSSDTMDVTATGINQLTVDRAFKFFARGASNARTSSIEASPPEAMTGIETAIRQRDRRVEVEALEHPVALNVRVDDGGNPRVLELPRDIERGKFPSSPPSLRPPHGRRAHRARRRRGRGMPALLPSPATDCARRRCR